MRFLPFLALLLPFAAQAELLQAPSRADVFVVKVGLCMRKTPLIAFESPLFGWGTSSENTEGFVCSPKVGSIFGGNDLLPKGSVATLTEETAVLDETRRTTGKFVSEGAKLLVLGYLTADTSGFFPAYAIVQKVADKEAPVVPTAEEALRINVGICSTAFFRSRFTPGNTTGYRTVTPIESVLGENQGLDCSFGEQAGTTLSAGSTLPPVGSVATLENVANAFSCRAGEACRSSELPRGTKVRVISYRPFNGNFNDAIDAMVVPVP